MSWGMITALGIVNVLLILFLSPLYEGLMRKLKAVIHSRTGPPIIQPYLDLLKLLGKEDLRAQRGLLYSAAPSIALGSVLALSLLIPIGSQPPLGFAGDIIVFIYVAAMSCVLVMMTAFGSASPYASIGGSREMMMMLCVEPVMAVALVVGAVKAGTLALGGIRDWQISNGPSISMIAAAIGFLLALQAQAGKLPFDAPEADQEIMGGPLIEQSGPRLALFRWTMWARQLVFAIVLVELFLPWPHVGFFVADVVLTLVKSLVILGLVLIVDVVNPRLRIDQAMGYFLRVAFATLAALAFAVIGR